MEAMIDTLTSPESDKYSPHTRIILITPPPVNTVKRAKDLEARTPPVALDRNFDVTKQYAEAVVGLAQKRGLAYVDVWTAVWEAAGQVEEQLSQYLPDGLHLNGNGYGVRKSSNRPIHPSIPEGTPKQTKKMTDKMGS
jgi:isoamyl acetate esterase